MTTSLDQAATLRRGTVPPEGRGAGSPALVAIASGKGGVGKTFLAINLALALQERGRRCALVDLDWGLANVDVALGLAPRRHLGHVLAGECAVDDAMVEHAGLCLLPNACGEAAAAELGVAQLAGLFAGIGRSLPECSVIVADTHPGIGAQTLAALGLADLVAVVTTPEPTSVTDTYALLKVLQRSEGRARTGLVVNEAANREQAHETARQLDLVAGRFLGRRVECWGWVPQSMGVPRSVRRQRALLQAEPHGLASAGVRSIAARLEPMLQTVRTSSRTEERERHGVS